MPVIKNARLWFLAQVWYAYFDSQKNRHRPYIIPWLILIFVIFINSIKYKPDLIYCTQKYFLCFKRYKEKGLVGYKAYNLPVTRKTGTVQYSYESTLPSFSSTIPEKWSEKKVCTSKKLFIVSPQVEREKKKKFRDFVKGATNINNSRPLQAAAPYIVETLYG